MMTRRLVWLGIALVFATLGAVIFFMVPRPGVVPRPGTTGRAPSPRPPIPAATPSPELPTLVLDLATLPAEDKTPRQVPPGKLWLVFENRAPQRGYVFKATYTPQTGSEQTLRPQAVPPGLSPPPGCGHLYDATRALSAATEEVETAVRVQRVKELAPTCPSESLSKGALSSVEFRWLLPANPGLITRLTISRLGTNADAPDRQWTLLFTAPVASAGALYHTETEWIASEISSEIAATLVFAKDRSRLPAGALELRAAAAPKPGVDPAFRVSVRLSASGAPFSADLALRPHAWAPEAYAPFARSLQSALGLSAQVRTTPPTDLLLRVLTVPRIEIIEAQNRRISRLLARDLLDADAHEQAALLLGVFALREASGAFHDVRPTLCSMAAHLALANAFRGDRPPGTGGRFAEAVLSSLAGRPGPAQGVVDTLRRSAATPAERSWARALTLRNTRDWTLFPHPAQATLLERLEYARAVRASLGVIRGSDISGSEARREGLPDWARIALASGVSLDDGHMFVNPAQPLDPLDLMEMRQVFPEALSTAPTAEQLAAALNLKPPRMIGADSDRVPSQVIPKAAWAAFFQRHLLARIDGGAYWLRLLYGVPEQADEYEASAKSLFGALRYDSLLSLRLSTGVQQDPSRAAKAAPALRAACAGLARLLVEDPSLVTAHFWTAYGGRCAPERTTGAFPRHESWLDPVFPPGTAFEGSLRIGLPESIEKSDLSDLERLWQLSPFDTTVAFYYLGKKFGGQETPEQYIEILGPLLTYDLRAMFRLMELQKNQPAAYRKTFERVCVLNPEQYLALGAYLVEEGLDTEAVAAYEKGYRVAHPVAVANEMRWLVNYYYDHGQSAKALALAQEVAGTYSSAGLETLGRLYERMGDYANAERGRRLILERYDREDQLKAFYARYALKVGDDRFGDKSKESLAQLFPKGVAKLTAKDPPKFPLSGPTVIEVGKRLEGAGLRLGDVVVALDGYQTSNVAQFEAIRLLSQDPPLRIVVRRGMEYVELSGQFTGHLLSGIRVQ